MAQAKHQAITDKQQILDTLTPKAVLQPMAAEAADAVPESQLIEGYVVVVRFPFRVGRESRVKLVNGRLGRTERPKFGNEEPNNDLYLIDRGSLLNISREHFSIQKEEGGYLLIDRGSACGTSIGNTIIGGDDTGGSHPLRDGDLIGIGTSETPYRYRLIVLNPD